MLAPAVLAGGTPGCGQTEADPGGVEATPVAFEAPAPAPTPDTSIEQKYLPGLGYFDGTTCDSWPKDVSFSSVTSFLGRVSTTAPQTFLQGTKALNTRMTAMGITGATVFGAKRELVVVNGGVSAPTGVQTMLLAVDASSRQGYMLDNTWLCTEKDLQSDPLNCKVWDAVVGQPSANYKVLGRVTQLSVSRSQNTVLLVAPQVRFAQGTSTALVTNLNLVAMGQRVYGGAPYSNGEDLSKRTSGLVTLKAIPSIPSFGTQPSTSQWKVAIIQPRKPSLLALIADETGGFQQVTAYAPTPIESVVVSPTFTEAAHYDAATGRLTLRPEEFFRPTFTVFQPTNAIDPYCDIQNTGVGSPYGSQSCDYHLTLAATPLVRAAGGSGAAFVISGSTTNTATVSAITATALRASYSASELRTFIQGIVNAKFNPPKVPHFFWTSLMAAPVGAIDSLPWRNLASTYQATTLITLTSSLASLIDTAFPARTASFNGLVSTTTSSSDMAMAANLFSRGTFVDALYARSEIESLRAGPIAPSWKDSWRLMSEATLNSTQITSFDAVADFGASAAKRARAREMSRYLTIAEPGGMQSNVLGLPYGAVAGGLYALRAATGDVSIYAARNRWGSLASLVDDFQTRADQLTQLQNAAQRDTLVKALDVLRTNLGNQAGMISQAGTTLSAAAKQNFVDQAKATSEFQAAFNALLTEDNAAQASLASLVGCSPAVGDCPQKVSDKLQALQKDCQTDNGLAWLNTVVSVVEVFQPELLLADQAIKKYNNGQGLVASMGEVLKAASPGETPARPDIGTFVTALKGADDDFAQIDKSLQTSDTAGTRMNGLVNQFFSCPAGGSAQANLDDFKRKVQSVNNAIHNLGTQIRMAHAQIDSVLGNVAYLASQGQAYDTLSDTASNLQKDLNAKTDTLLSSLRGLSDGAPYSQVAAQEKAFLTSACQTALGETRTGLADLYLISQALQTSTGRTSTKPYMVVPANPAYHFAGGATPTGMRKFDFTRDFAFSLWDDGAFSSRFTADASSSTSLIDQAQTRFTQLMNTEVCETDPLMRPAGQFIVRKYLTGQALRTLASNGKVDFAVGIDDVATGGLRSPDVKAAVSRDLSNGTFDIQLGGAFVIGAGYAVCNGTTPGLECSSVVASASLPASLNGVYLVNRGQVYMPSAPPATGCTSGQLSVTSQVPVDPNGTNYRLAACLTSQATPRASMPAPYFSDAADSDKTFLPNHQAQCMVDASVLASRPLQGLPVMGTWALANSLTNVTPLVATAAMAPISDTAPAVPGITAIEVVFVVGTEPVETAPVSTFDPASYALIQ